MKTPYEKSAFITDWGNKIRKKKSSLKVATKSRNLADKSAGTGKEEKFWKKTSEFSTQRLAHLREVFLGKNDAKTTLRGNRREIESTKRQNL